MKEAVKAGVLLAAEGLTPTSKGAWSSMATSAPSSEDFGGGFTPNAENRESEVIVDVTLQPD